MQKGSEPFFPRLAMIRLMLRSLTKPPAQLNPDRHLKADGVEAIGLEELAAILAAE